MDYKGCGGGGKIQPWSTRREVVVAGCFPDSPGVLRSTLCKTLMTIMLNKGEHLPRGTENMAATNECSSARHIISTSAWASRAWWPGQPSEPGGKGSTPVWINLPLPYHVLTMCGHRDSIPLRYDMPNADGFLTWSVSESP